MLVLTRKSNQSIMIGDEIEVSVLSVMGEKVRIGIQAPQKVPVFRKEIYLEIHRDDVEVVPRESPGALADAVIAALAEPRRTRGATSDTLEREFRPKAVASNYYRIYRAVADLKARATKARAT